MVSFFSFLLLLLFRGALLSFPAGYVEVISDLYHTRQTKFRVTLVLVHCLLELMAASLLEDMFLRMRRPPVCFSARVVVKNEWPRFKTRLVSYHPLEETL